ncbi:MAG TPA: Holliday junction resolvase RecU [Candidatus Lokiarchaeia archaeon]|nr:Holliday junction resolvase RecU [Candidatus Lokiarchaeia archaeon]
MNELEEAFDRGQRHFLPDMFVINQPDLGWLVQKAQVATFTRTQLPDRILLHKKLGAWCFELKQNKGSSFAFARLKEHQGQQLEDFALKVGKAFVVISFNGLDRVFAIPISSYRFLERSVGRKSLKLSDLDALPDPMIKEVPVEVPKNNPRLNLSILVTRDLRDYLKT